MEPLWSPVVAIGGNRSQIASTRKRPKQAETVAVGCDRLPQAAHGKEGVDGSSPSEGFTSLPVKPHVALPRLTLSGCGGGFGDRFWGQFARPAALSPVTSRALGGRRLISDPGGWIGITRQLCRKAACPSLSCHVRTIPLVPSPEFVGRCDPGAADEESRPSRRYLLGRTTSRSERASRPTARWAGTARREAALMREALLLVPRAPGVRNPHEVHVGG
jgi:hypothetical protein